MAQFTYSPCPECRKLNRIPWSAVGEPVCGSCKAALPIHGGINELGASDLTTLIEKAPLPVLVDFWAPWCGPCKAFAPVFQRASHELAGQVILAKVDTQAHPRVASTYGIRGIPTLIFFQDGLEKQRQSGALPHPALLAWVRSVIQPADAA